MHIAVNAVALRSAGGRSVAINFLRAFQEATGGHTIVLFAPAHCGYEAFQLSPSIEVHLVPAHFEKAWLRPLTDHFWLSKQIEACRPDVIFSMGNFAAPSHRPQVVLFMWPYATYPDSEVWGQMSLVDRWTRRAKIRSFRQRLKYATVVAPQTQTSADRLKRYYPEAKRLHVVPTAVALNKTGVPLGEEQKMMIKADGHHKLLCLTRYYPHKNLEILLDLAKRIKRENKQFLIITTISADQHPDAGHLLDQIKGDGLEDVIRNIGPVPMDEVPALYALSDGLLLPTLLESFSGAYVDAMYFRKPIFTSDRDFAKEVCGDHAFYFDPHAAQNILDVLDHAFGNADVITSKTLQAAQRVEHFPDWHQVANMYLQLMQSLSNKATGEASTYKITTIDKSSNVR